MAYRPSDNVILLSTTLVERITVADCGHFTFSAQRFPFGEDRLSGRDCGGETARSATEALRRPHKLTLSSPWLRRTGANLIVPLISAAHSVAAPAYAPPVSERRGFKHVPG